MSNSDNLFQEYDGNSEVKWRKILRKQDKELKEKEGTFRDLEFRLVEEIKAFTRGNAQRSRLLIDLGALSAEEAKTLAELEKVKVEMLEEMERLKNNPSPRKNILEEFKNRKQKMDDKKKMDREKTEAGRSETAGSRHGGRFTGRTTPRGGTMHLAKGAKAQRELHESELDPFLRRGVYGNRIAVDRRGGPDPVAALFNQSNDPSKIGGTGFYVGNLMSNDDDYAEFLGGTTPRGLTLNTSNYMPDDVGKGSTKKNTSVRTLPKI